MASQPLPNNHPTRPDLSLVGDRGRVPPQDLEAEEAVLGAMLLRREVIGEVLQIVKPEMFFVPKHQMVFQTLVDLYERNSQIDPLVVKDELVRRTSSRRWAATPSWFRSWSVSPRSPTPATTRKSSATRRSSAT